MQKEKLPYKKCFTRNCDAPRTITKSILGNEYYMKYCRYHHGRMLSKAKCKGIRRKIDKDGYVLIRPEEYGQLVYEHRIIMAEKLGRPLKKYESVHHINGIRDDNRPENLQLWIGGIRYGQSASDIVCPHCKKPYMLRTNSPEIRNSIHRNNNLTIKPRVVDNLIAYRSQVKRCKIEGCGWEHFGRGLCNLHWQREYGIKRSPEYHAWGAMKQRCYNKNHKCYKYYGGRGIKICDEWRCNYKAFHDYVGDRPTPEHSLDRIDNDGNYEPDNVRWATKLGLHD